MRYFVEVELKYGGQVQKWIDAPNPDEAVFKLEPILAEKYGDDFKIRKIRPDDFGEVSLVEY